MEEEIDTQVDETLEDFEADSEETEEPQEEETDTTDWKAKALEAQGIAKRYKTRYEKLKGGEAKPEEKTGELDYGHLAFHNSKSGVVKIEHDEDMDYLKSMMEETGKPQKVLLESKWFQAEIKERQDARAVKDAIPSTTKRSAPSGKGTVDYWLAKGELPPADQVQLRRDVLNARIQKETDGSKFSDNSVVVS